MKNNRGFTLVELMAGLAIMAIIAVPLAKFFMDGFKVQARGQAKTEATKVCEYVAEQLKKGNYFAEEDEEEFEEDEWEIAKWFTSYDGEKTELTNEVYDKFVISQIDEDKKLTSRYRVEVRYVDVIEEKNDKILQVSYGEPTLIFKEDGNVETVDNNNFSYLNPPILEISSGGTILIKNENIDSQTVYVKKETAEDVTIYKSGNSINIINYFTINPNPELSSSATQYEVVNLGEKGENSDKPEVICRVKITAINSSDNTITATMESTVTIPIVEIWT